jgi:hypothetical protein
MSQALTAAQLGTADDPQRVVFDPLVTQVQRGFIAAGLSPADALRAAISQFCKYPPRCAGVASVAVEGIRGALNEHSARPRGPVAGLAEPLGCTEGRHV